MTALWRDRYKLATAILATSLLVGLVAWSGVAQGISAWWNSYQIWYYYADYKDAPQDGNYRTIKTKGGWEYSDGRLFECRITEEFYQGAMQANYHWSLDLPADRCREILP